MLEKVVKQQRGAWPHSWYNSVVCADMVKRDGTIQETTDYEAQKGDSRNLCLVIASLNGSQPQHNTMFINYRPEALFDEGRRNEVIGNREANMRDHISLERLKDVEEALGEIKPNGNGGIDAHRWVGKECRVYLGVFQKRPSGAKDPLPVRISDYAKMADDEKERTWNQITRIAPAASAKK